MVHRARAPRSWLHSCSACRLCFFSTLPQRYILEVRPLKSRQLTRTRGCPFARPALWVSVRRVRTPWLLDYRIPSEVSAQRERMPLGRGMHHSGYHDPLYTLGGSHQGSAISCQQGSAINVEQRLVASRGRALEMARVRGCASLGFRINNQHFGVSGMLAC
jgi:hypothetical protein